jgi:hypothetical protein
MLPGRRNEPGEPSQKGERLEEDGALPVLGRLSKGELDAAVAGHAELSFCEGGASHIPAELLASLLVFATNGDAGVDAEATALDGRAEDADGREHRWLRETAEEPMVGGVEVLRLVIDEAFFWRKSVIFSSTWWARSSRSHSVGGGQSMKQNESPPSSLTKTPSRTSR